LFQLYEVKGATNPDLPRQVIAGRLRISLPPTTTEIVRDGAIGAGTRRAPPGVHCSLVADLSGDTGSFEELAMPLFARLYNFAHWLTQEQASAEDLVQETYMKALRGFSSFQQGTNFRAWMYRILRNTFLTTQAGLKASASISLDSDDGQSAEPAAAETPESALLAHAEQETIQSALEKLPVKFREIILLCDLEEMSYQEIGATLGIPLGTVMSRLSRARKAMRELLAPKLQGTSR
jgi:RNA polymerase sigma-70 factor, ECF subfamily